MPNSRPVVHLVHGWVRPSESGLACRKHHRPRPAVPPPMHRNTVAGIVATKPQSEMSKPLCPLTSAVPKTKNVSTITLRVTMNGKSSASNWSMNRPSERNAGSVGTQPRRSMPNATWSDITSVQKTRSVSSCTQILLIHGKWPGSAPSRPGLGSVLRV